MFENLPTSTHKVWKRNTHMINPEEVVNKAKELDVHPYNVQRDYIFGWVLAGIYTASDLGTHLILKGGNCFRKAYFESARYSPDLDFATPEKLTEDYLSNQIKLLCDFVETKTGVKFERERTRVEEKQSADKAKFIHEARLYFHDFFGEESQIIISIRMDISELEKIFLPVQTRNLIHSYSDKLACECQIKCLKLEEMLAGKLKCLLQRRHSADLYDFVNATFISPTIDLDQAEIVSTFLKMTIFGSGPRIVKDLLFNLPFQIIHALWDKYLVFPRTSIIDFDNAVDGFKRVIHTLFGTLQLGWGEIAFFPADLRNPIMEAGHNLTLLRIVYDGVEREVEPYSLKYKTRKDGVGREYLYVYDRTGGRTSAPGLKSLVHQNFQAISNTDIQFEPRTEVELSKAGQFFQEQYFHSTPRYKTMRSFFPKSSHNYTIQCPVCGKRFYREKYSTKLNPHKDTYGNKCYGKIGYFV
jgi:predicted nucleotidyltransferase component of viral defense system